MERELATLKARNAELDSLFNRIYEDSVSGKISEERFAKMSRMYEDEQTENEQLIDLLSHDLLIYRKRTGTAKDFLATIKRYTRMKRLTPEILREFVDKIIVHHRQRIDGVDEQKIEIFYSVGKIEVPDRAKVPQVDVCMPIRKGVVAHYSPDRKSA